MPLSVPGTVVAEGYPFGCGKGMLELLGTFIFLSSCLKFSHLYIYILYAYPASYSKAVCFKWG